MDPATEAEGLPPYRPTRNSESPELRAALEIHRSARWQEVLDLARQAARMRCNCCDRDDVLGEVLVRMVSLGDEHIAQVRNIRAYSAAVVRNQDARCRNAEKEQRCWPCVVANSSLLEGRSVGRRLDPGELHRMVEALRERLLAPLSLRDRRVYFEVYVAGSPKREAASTLGLSPGQVKRSIARIEARKKSYPCRWNDLERPKRKFCTRLVSIPVAERLREPAQPRPPR